MYKITVAVLIVMATNLLIAIAPSTKIGIYQNQEFGITIPIPKGLPTCSGANDPHDHGIAIFLDPNDINKDCFDEEHRRTIYLFAFFNATDETKTLKDYLEWECSTVHKGRCIPAPKGLRIDGFHSASGRVDHADGWIDIVVVTQAGRSPGQAPDDPHSAVNYSVGLLTTPACFEKDLCTFRKVLHTIRLSPPR